MAIAAAATFGGKWLAPVIGGLFSGASAARANRERREEAKRNREFQERMSSTAHQREVKDLRAAGLNPILSATGGRGSSSPGGSMAAVEPLLPGGASTALATQLQIQQLKNMKQTERLTEEQTRALGGVAEFGDTLGDILGFLRGNAGDVTSAMESARMGATNLMEQAMEGVGEIRNSAESIGQRIRRSVPKVVRDWYERRGRRVIRR